MASLFDMSIKRTAGQAVGYYFFYLVIGMLLGGLSSMAIVVLYCVFTGQCQTPEEGTEIGKLIGTKVGYVSCFLYITALALWQILAKKLYRDKNKLAIVLSALSMLLAIPVGAVFALIPLAFITTFENLNKQVAEEETEYLSNFE